MRRPPRKHRRLRRLRPWPEMESSAEYPDLLEPGLSEPKVRKRARKKKKKSGGQVRSSPPAVNVHVNVSTNHGGGASARNQADSALERLRGF
jgi:hypothetical protein